MSNSGQPDAESDAAPLIPPGAVATLAASLAEAAADAAPELSLSRFAASLDAWARSEALAVLLADRLDALSPFTPRGQPRSALLAAYATAERTASNARISLGLAPASAASILSAVRSGGIALLGPTERERLGLPV